MTEIPQAAIDAAALVLAHVEGHPEPEHYALADDVLTAAAPHLAAAERERAGYWRKRWEAACDLLDEQGLARMTAWAAEHQPEGDPS